MHTLNREATWDFIAGSLPLDFANTAEWHARSNPVERLNTYADLVTWSWKGGLLTEGMALLLLEMAERRPQKAQEVLVKAIAVREAIYRLFSSISAGRKAPKEALDILNRALSETLKRARIEPSTDGYVWGWSDKEQSLDHMLWPILHSTAELLTSEDLDRVGECADDRGCGYLFFDSSRNRSRRWCSMEDCGNRAKAQRHYKRKRTQS